MSSEFDRGFDIHDGDFDKVLPELTESKLGRNYLGFTLILLSIMSFDVVDRILMALTLGDKQPRYFNGSISKT